VAYCEVADIQDLAVHPGDIRLSETVPQAGDSITVYATVHNISTSAAMGVTVEIRDLRADTMLGTSAVDFAAGSAVTVQAPWVPAAPDSHEIQVRVSPYVLDENDYSNNTASRVIVLGSPVGVDPGGVPPRLRFDPPCPNPTSHAVVFSFSVPRQATGSLFIFDVLGRRVQSWSWAELSPGAILSSGTGAAPLASDFRPACTCAASASGASSFNGESCCAASLCAWGELSRDGEAVLWASR